MSGSSISAYPYPANNRTHGVFAVIDPTGANTGQANYPTIIIAPMLSTGAAAVPNLPVLMPTGEDSLRQLLGAGSVGALMAARYVQEDPFGTVYLLPVLDAPAGVAATLVITFGGTVTAQGTVPLYVAGVNVPVAAAVGQTGAQTAAAVAAAINAMVDLPVTAAVGTGANAAVVTLTAKNLGLTGNEADVRLAYYGAPAGEVVPTGMTVTGILVGTGTQLAGGQQNPSLASALANLPATPYDYYVTPYTDPASLNALQTFFNDTTGRWSWQQMLYGGGFAGYRGTQAACVTFGLTRNDPAMTVTGQYDAPEPAWIWAADLAGNCAASLRADPAIPLQELVLGVLPPPVQNRFDAIGERNTLLYAGISTVEVDQAGQVIIDRQITTYQTAPSGAPDTSYLDVETRYSLAALIRDMRIFLQTTYARKKLVADGTNIPGGSNMVTSQTVLSSAWGRYATYCNNGQAQNYANFKANSRATNAGNGQVSLLLPFDLPNQLRQIVMVVDFLKS